MWINCKNYNAILFLFLRDCFDLFLDFPVKGKNMYACKLLTPIGILQHGFLIHSDHFFRKNPLLLLVSQEVHRLIIGMSSYWNRTSGIPSKPRVSDGAWRMNEWIVRYQIAMTSTFGIYFFLLCAKNDGLKKSILFVRRWKAMGRSIRKE